MFWRTSGLIGTSSGAGISIVVVTTPGSVTSHWAWNLSPSAPGRVVGKHQSVEPLDTVDLRRNRKRTKQQRADATVLVGVCDGEHDLGRGGVVDIADEAGVGDDRPVGTVGEDPDEVVDIVDLE